jgi:hypothetical protein
MSDSKGFGLLQVANAVGFAATAVVNILANALPLNGKTTAELSDAYPNLITPAGYVFSIWGIIYVLLMAFVVYQFLPGRKDETFIGRIGYLFLFSCGTNISWIFLWHYEQVLLSVPVMFALLGSLILIYTRLNIGGSDVGRRERLLVHLPFSVYLGWITVAPIANVAAAMVSMGLDGLGLGEPVWAALMIAVAVILTVLVIYTRGDLAYSLVIVWALGGIIVKQSAVQMIVVSSGAGIIAILAAMVVRRFTSSFQGRL